LQITFTLYDESSTPNRMIVKRRQEMHAEVRADGEAWAPIVQNEFGRDVWEKERGNWKLVETKILSVNLQKGDASLQ